MLIKTFAPQDDAWLTLENAGSMADIFLEHILITLGLPPEKVKDVNGQSQYPTALQIALDTGPMRDATDISLAQQNYGWLSRLSPCHGNLDG